MKSTEYRDGMKSTEYGDTRSARTPYRGGMKRILTALLCLAIPGLLLLNAWQGYRYTSLSSEVSALEARQDELLEANRDAIGQIAFESSPDRVLQRAADLGLKTADDSVVQRLSVGAAGAVQSPAPGVGR
jgi:hypothetical protein